VENGAPAGTLTCAEAINGYALQGERSVLFEQYIEKINATGTIKDRTRFLINRWNQSSATGTALHKAPRGRRARSSGRTAPPTARTATHTRSAPRRKEARTPLATTRPGPWDSTDNQTAGSRPATWYNDDRILDEDALYVT
jgi:hypothetical protein